MLGFVSLLKRCRYLFFPSTSTPLLSLLCHFTLACAPDQQQLGAAENVTSRILGGAGETRVRPSWLSGNVNAWLEQSDDIVRPDYRFIERRPTVLSYQLPGLRMKSQHSPARPVVVSSPEMQHDMPVGHHASAAWTLGLAHVASNHLRGN